MTNRLFTCVHTHTHARTHTYGSSWKQQVVFVTLNMTCDVNSVLGVGGMTIILQRTVRV